MAALDHRVMVLIQQRSFRCSLRRCHKEVRVWVGEALQVYQTLYARPDKDSMIIKSILNEIYALLRGIFGGNEDGKRDKIMKRWPKVQEKLATL